jgi:hypothetical protein
VRRPLHTGRDDAGVLRAIVAVNGPSWRTYLLGLIKKLFNLARLFSREGQFSEVEMVRRIAVEQRRSAHESLKWVLVQYSELQNLWWVRLVVWQSRVRTAKTGRLLLQDHRGKPDKLLRPVDVWFMFAQNLAIPECAERR